MSSKRVEMWGEGLEAKGGVRSWERWARGEGRGCVRGVCPPLPYQTLENKFSVFSSQGGVTPLRVGRTTGANPGGYQAGARGIFSQGDL